ncbi:MAG TPA: DUF120 domain-containing protein [Candidatus Nanoarchaeia archaeon]|nr:DUF120 domain-containing protein [Candidatus Nanoarchaeia archaeon]
MVISGQVVSGLGEGKYYVEKYQPYFVQKLGYACFLGTLNFRIREPVHLPENKKIIIKPREGGQVDCYPVLINKAFKGAIVVPHKSRHGQDILEVVSPVCLRKVLGSEIKCELE